jgi:hypothetical protein
MPPKRHLIITGTGRTGTTFLVQLMTELGMDTGFSDATSAVLPHCDAGMEIDIRSPQCPYVVKNPRLCHELAQVLRDGVAIIDHAIVPMRDMYAAAESRRAVRIRAGTMFGGGEIPGGLWDTDKPEGQEAVLATYFYQLLETIARHDVPVTLLHFPRLVNDADYLYRSSAPSSRVSTIRASARRSIGSRGRSSFTISTAA